MNNKLMKLLSALLFLRVVALGDDMLRIHNSSEFRAFLEDVNGGNNYEGKTVFLESDIDFAEEDYEPIGKDNSKYFSGTFNGQGHKISNLTLSSSSLQYVGLFGYSKGLTIKNIIIDNTCSFTGSYSSNKAYVGSFIGNCEASSKPCIIENSINMANIFFSTEKDLLIGGFAGRFFFPLNNDDKSVIRNCVNYGSVISSGTSGGKSIGGIAGNPSASYKNVYIYNCYNYGDVTYNGTLEDVEIGGIGGYVDSVVIENCVNYGNLTSSVKSDYIGNIGGSLSYSTISYCYYNANINYDIYGDYGDPEESTISNIAKFDDNFELNTAISIGKFNGNSLIEALNAYSDYYKVNGYSRWVLNKDKNKVSFITVNATSFTIDSQIILLPTLSSEEKLMFDGWYTDSDCTSQFTDFVINTNTDLYGEYKENNNNYTIFFDTGDNGYTANPITAQVGTVVALPKLSSKNGCTVESWQNDHGEEVSWDFVVPAYNITLYDVSTCIYIGNVSKFIEFAISVNGGTDYNRKTIFLNSDLDFNGKQLEPIGKDLTNYFRGTLDGQGYIIKNLLMQYSSLSYVGLFGYSQGTTIRNLVVDESCSFTGSLSVGAFIGMHDNHCNTCNFENNINMANITFDQSSDNKDLYLGGMVGKLSTSYKFPVKNCVNYGSITFSGKVEELYIGGIAGYSEGWHDGNDGFYVYIQNCFNYGIISYTNTSKNLYVGGISGKTRTVTFIENSINMASITIAGASSGSLMVGGITGYFYSEYESTLKNCANYGSISFSGESNELCAGGVSGYSKTSIDKNYIQNNLNYGTISYDGTTNNFYIGGIAGKGKKTFIEGCVSVGGIESSNTSGSIGGITGSSSEEVNITQCIWTTNIDYNASGDILNEDDEATQVDFDCSLTDKLNNISSNTSSKWLLNLDNYTVTFMVNDKEWFISDSQIILLQSFDEDDGQNFSGWYEDNMLSLMFNKSEITSNITLYGMLCSSNYTVTFDANGGVELNLASVSIECNGTYDELPTVNKLGHTFAGWYTERGKGKKAEMGERVIVLYDHTLYAIWTANNYTVTLNATGGSVLHPSINVTYDKTYDGLIDATRIGYTFIGWFTEEDGTGDEITSGDTVNITDDQALYAQWIANNYTVTFNATGGNVSEESINVTYDDAYGDLPEPNKTGYTFVGWFIEEDGTGDEIENTTKVTITDDQTLYAQWTANNYTVTLNATGGSVSQETINVTYGKTYKGLINATRVGYIFVGWFIEEDGTGDEITNTTKVTITDDQTLYAQWTANNYTVTLNATGGNVSQESINVTYDDAYGDLPEPNRTGYTFVGWFNESGRQATSGDTVKITDDQTLYAKWIANNYTVTFNATGGNVSEESINVTYDDAYGDLPEPNRTGYTFVGWFAEEDGTGDEITNTTKVTITDDQVLYAQWIANNYTVTLNATGGSASHPSINVTYDKTYDGLSDATRIGYIFVGWFTEEDGTGDEIENTTKVIITDDQTLYALWTANNYTVTLNATGGNVSEESINVTYDDAYGDLPEPNRTGYTFAGWFNESGKQVISEDTVKIIDDQTLYAKWIANNYTVTLNATGGSVSHPSINVTYDKTYDGLIDATRIGYIFVGWFTEEDGNGKQVTSGDIVKIIGDQVLYAQWIANNYVVTLNATGGNVPYRSINVKYDDAYGELPNATRTGYTFTGWFNESGGQITSRNTVKIAGSQVLYAQWIANNYTVTLNTTGGNVSQESINVTYDKTYDGLINATRTGYTFGGWFTGEHGSGDEIENTTKVTITDDKTLYAQWTANNYTMTLNATGGSVSHPSINVTYDNTYGTLPEPNKTGYTFAGWFTEEDGKGKQVTSGNIVKIIDDQVLYTKWIANNYNVIFNTTGGNVPYRSINVKYDDTYGELPNATRTGYTFTGWFNESGGQITSGNTVKITGNQVLYAQWIANNYTVPLNATGGNVSQESINVTYDKTYKGLINATRTGYTFAGWFTGEHGSGDEIENTTKVTITDDKTLYAKWTANNYTVTLNATSGNVLHESINVTYDSTYGTLPEPNKTGYGFAGWFTEEDGKGKQVTGGDTVKITDNQTLYAYWKFKEFIITFNATGGNVPYHSINVKYDNNYGELPNATRTGYTFVGWFNENGGQVMSEGTVKITGNQVLYAQWIANNYTVNFNATGGYITEESREVNYDDNYGDLPEPNKIGYTFAGWFTGEHGSGDEIENSTIIETPENITLYAYWIINNYTVTFDPNNGDKKQEVAFEYGAPIECPNDLTNGACTLNGWNNSIKYMPTENITIAAQWICQTVTIVFSTKTLTKDEVEEKIKEFVSEENVIIMFTDNDDGTVTCIIRFIDQDDTKVTNFVENIKADESLKDVFSHIDINGEDVPIPSGGDDNTTTIIVVVVVIMVVVVAVLLGFLGLFFIKRNQVINEGRRVVFDRIMDQNAEPIDASEFKSHFKKRKKIYPDDYPLPTSIVDALMNAGLAEDASKEAEEICKYNAIRSSENGYVTGAFTLDDAAAVSLYTFDFGGDKYEMNPYRLLNKALRSEKKTIKKICEVRDILYLIMSALRKLPVASGIILYRGIRERVDVEQYEVGSTIIWPGFSSTSPDINITKSFLAQPARGSEDDGENTAEGSVELSENPEGDDRATRANKVEGEGTLFIIEDGWGYNVQPYSQYPDEEEILLEPEREFEVTNVEDTNNLITVTLKMKNTKVILPKVFGDVQK